MTNTQPKFISTSVLGLAAFFALTAMSHADGMTTPPIKDPLVAKECSACHMLYPAGLLPARSWTKLTAGLQNHFGDNAELDAAATAAITAYLTTNAADQAGRNSKVLRDLPKTAEPLRITELPWWRRKHDRKDRTSPATLTRKGAKFKGDCAACHKEAAKGVFDED
ncbi:MAG: hypothetical protein ABL898_01925 [Hyphomicrobiaceae bacterium]